MKVLNTILALSVIMVRSPFVIWSLSLFYPSLFFWIVVSSVCLVALFALHVLTHYYYENTRLNIRWTYFSFIVSIISAMCFEVFSLVQYKVQQSDPTVSTDVKDAAFLFLNIYLRIFIVDALMALPLGLLFITHLHVLRRESPDDEYSII